MGMLSIVSYFLGIVLFLFGILPFFGMSLPISSTVQTILIMASALWMAVDGFSEEHMFKYITLFYALFFALFVAVPLLNAAGYLPFSLPAFLVSFSQIIYAVAGVLLFLGPFFYDSF